MRLTVEATSTPARERTAPAGSAGRFRPDIEGIRAIAVVAVLAYHAGVPFTGGGFVGVDVFFVISGFLITGQMLRDVDGPGLSFRTFYARRARRLLPAATLVIIATLIGSALVLSPLQQAATGADARAASLFFANMRFAGQATNYFAAFRDPSPFQHFWSLSLEEQFYLVWPAVVLLALVASGRSPRNHRRRLAVVLAVVVVPSFVFCVWLTSYSQPWAFFALPPRAWELALGALLAVGSGWIAPVGSFGRQVVGWVGLVLVVASVVLLSDKVTWPGYLVAIPVVGTTFMIAAGIGGGRGPLGRLLALRPCQAVGRYSYSLYLWHWPVLVLAASVFPTVRTNWVKASGVVLVSVVPAVVSYHLVENPVRHAPRFRPRNAALALGAVLIAASVAASVLYGAVTVGDTLDTGRPAPVSGDAIGTGLPITDYVPSDMKPALNDLGGTLGTTVSPACHEVDEGIASVTCVLGDGDAPPSMVLFGDSHAAMWTAAFEEYANRRGIRIRRLSAGGCGSLLYPPTGGSTKNCDDFRQQAFDLIATEKPALVVLVNKSFAGYERDPEEWERGVRATIERISPSSRVVILGETPYSEVDVADCLARHLDDTRQCEPPPHRPATDAIIDRERRITEETGQGYIDTRSWVCADDRCPAVVGDRLVYRDKDHLSVPFVLSRVDLLTAALDEQLARAGRAAAG